MDDQSEAELYLRRAIDIAQNQNSKSLELRSTISLSHFLLGNNRTDETFESLSEIYNWFSEGFDTRDLKQSKSLLDNLSTSQN